MADYDWDDTESRQDLNPLERLGRSFQDEVEELAKLDLEVEEFAERKAGLLRAYIEDDVHGIRQFWRDLRAETQDLESFLGYWLLKAANPAHVDWSHLDQYLQRQSDQWLAGDTVANRRLECVSCGNTVTVTEEQTLGPCSRCHCGMFHEVQA